MAGLNDRVASFLTVSSGSGDGSGYGSGSGSGSGSGDGYGYGYGDGYGSGYGYGYGSGSGDGYGYGYGDGYGSGYGYGDGDGYGSGDGYGDGYGYGSGIKDLNGTPVRIIDNTPTLIASVYGSIAHGLILHDDLTTEECYIAKQDNTFAHGKTLRKAMDALREKLFDDMPQEERIAAFIAEHDCGKEYPCRDLYDWHHRLTGSCEMGRNAFAKDHGIDVERDSMTVERFIELTRIAYGGEVIRALERAYKVDDG